MIFGMEKTNKRMPSLFIGHGSPMNAIQDSVFSQGIKAVAKSLPKPKAILCISAHWETKGVFVTAMEQPKTIHDFGGFPKKLYEVQYPAPGSPALAERVQSLVHSAKVELNYDWGLDHGCWSVVKYLFPEADVPVVELSLDYTQPASFHYHLAQELSMLRDEDVMLVASGNIIHNLRMLDWNKLDTLDSAYDWAHMVHDKMLEWIKTRNHRALVNYESQGKEFRLSAPTPDHLLPLLYVLATQGENEEVQFFNDSVVGGSLDMTSLIIR